MTENGRGAACPPDCKDRSQGCHGTCSRYAAYSIITNDAREKQAKKLKVLSDYKKFRENLDRFGPRHTGRIPRKKAP